MSPQRIPAYYICPRCSSRDIYFATRPAGTVGNIIDLPNGMANPTVGFQMEKKVAFCRPCGERADYFPEVVVYSEIEKKGQEKSRAKEYLGVGIFIFLSFGGLFIFVITHSDIAPEGYFTWGPLLGIVVGLLLIFGSLSEIRSIAKEIESDS